MDGNNDQQSITNDQGQFAAGGQQPMASGQSSDVRRQNLDVRVQPVDGNQPIANAAQGLDFPDQSSGMGDQPMGNQQSVQLQHKGQQQVPSQSVQPQQTVVSSQPAGTSQQVTAPVEEQSSHGAGSSQQSVDNQQQQQQGQLQQTQQPQQQGQGQGMQPPMQQPQQQIPAQQTEVSGDKERMEARPMDVNERVPLVEMREDQEFEPEVEGWLEKLEQGHEVKLPEPVMHEGEVLVADAGAAVVEDKIVLPMTQVSLAQGMKQTVTSGARWLAEWCSRLIKMFGNQVQYKDS